MSSEGRRSDDPSSLSTATLGRGLNTTLNILDRHEEGQEQITNHSQTSLLLQERQSCMAPVFRLPVELLVRIFLFCVPFPASSLSLNLSRGWISFSQVCSWWREIALSNPSLWTCPLFLNPRMTEVMLHRSRPLHVQLIANIDEIRAKTSQIIFKEAVGRSQAIGISTCHVNLASLVKSRPVWSASILESLSIAIHASGDNPLCRWTREDETSSPLLASLFRDNVPQLRSLELHDVFLPWKAPALRRLSSLTYSLTGMEETARATWIELAAILREMVYLENLSFIDALPLGAPPEHLDHKVNVPNIRRLCVQDLHRSVYALFRVLSISSKVMVDLNVHGRNRDGGSALYDILNRLVLGPNGDSQAQCLHIKATDGDRFTIRAWEDTGTRSDPKLCFSMSQFGHDDIKHLIRGLVAPPWSLGVVCLFVEAEEVYFDHTHWHWLFPLLSGVHSVNISGSTTVPFSYALVFDAIAATRAENLALPMLHTLAIDRWSPAFNRAFKCRGEMQVPLHELQGTRNVFADVHVGAQSSGVVHATLVENPMRSQRLARTGNYGDRAW